MYCLCRKAGTTQGGHAARHVWKYETDRNAEPDRYQRKYSCPDGKKPVCFHGNRRENL